MPVEVWEQDDKHRRAFWLLHESDPTDPKKGEEKRALVKRILGFDLAQAFTDGRYLRLRSDDDAETVRKVATVKACLRCHGTWPREADAVHVDDPPVPLELGVSCQACHGPGEKWDQPHRLVAWRVVTPEAKAELGFYDCRSAAGKVRLCVSCHVGNVGEEKFVKHEWYAAGHPPLPGFEPAAFQAQMPRHWKTLREKGDFAFRAQRPRDDSGQIARQMDVLMRSGVAAGAIKNSYLEANFSAALGRGVDPTLDLSATKDTVVGGLVVLESYATVLSEHARLSMRDGASWPELALYDCAACHHELRGGLGNAARPMRRGLPGRPPLATWTSATAALAAFQAANFDPATASARWTAVAARLGELERATTIRPFGDPAAMVVAADSLVEELERLRRAAEVTSYGAREAEGALRVLTAADTYETNDHASARQVAWAIQMIAAEAGYSQSGQLFEALGDDPLGLALPSGPRRSVMENLPRWLPAAAKYDAAWFRDELSTLRQRLESK